MFCKLQGKGKASKKGKVKKSKGDDEGYQAMVPSYEILASEYHSAMVAGLSLIGRCSALPRSSHVHAIRKPSLHMRAVCTAAVLYLRT